MLADGGYSSFGHLALRSDRSMDRTEEYCHAVATPRAMQRFYAHRIAGRRRNYRAFAVDTSAQSAKSTSAGAYARVQQQYAADRDRVAFLRYRMERLPARLGGRCRS